MSSFLFPTMRKDTDFFYSRVKSFLPLGDTTSYLLRNPNYKLLGLKYVPQVN